MNDGGVIGVPGGTARTWLGAAVVATAAAAAYANSFYGIFQFDDIPAILDNPTLRRLWPLGIPLRPPPGALTVSGRPVLNLSFALNYAVSGFHPWSYHALNLLIHIGVALALSGIVMRALQATTPDARSIALTVALIWAVHPLTTESVTYVVQRAESLMALFYVLTLYAFARSAEASGKLRRGAWMALSVALCWLGMGTKEVMVSAPITVLLYDRTFVTGSWRAVWRARSGYYLCLAASWVPLCWLVASSGWDRGGTSGFRVGVSWVGYWVTQGEAVVRYLGLALWPHPLVLDYGPSTAPLALAYLLSATVLAAFGATVAGSVRGRPWAFLPAVCYLILAPTSVMPGVLQFAAEHRMYLPLAAVLTAAVVAVNSAASLCIASERVRNWILGSILALAAFCLGAETVVRNRVYKDELVLWLDTVGKRPLSALAEANAGKALLERGRIAEGLVYCVKAVDLDPAKPVARYNLGLAYEEEKRWQEALGEFVAAAQLNPRLFFADFRAGRLLDRAGKGAEAERYLRLALANAPELAEAHGSLGVALGLQGRQEEAVDEFKRSISLDPDQPEVEFDLGSSLSKLGRLDEAVLHYSSAVRLGPKYGEAQLNLGVTLAQLGKYGESLRALEVASRLMPDSAQAHENLATILDQMGRSREAIAEYGAALRLKPAYAEAHYNLGNALIHAHELEAARDEFATALRQDPGMAAAREMLDRLAAAQ